MLSETERERRRKLSVALKKWWTPARRAKAAKLARINDRKWRAEKRLWDLHRKACDEAFAEKWPYSEIYARREWERRQWHLAHDDSGDWEIENGMVVRKRRYGKPIQERI